MPSPKSQSQPVIVPDVIVVPSVKIAFTGPQPAKLVPVNLVAGFGYTIICLVVVSLQPLLVVTIKVILYTPSLVYK